ncbi:TRAP transporter large permease subunit, partial [uncultured Desulfovibrio sp.]
AMLCGVVLLIVGSSTLFGKLLTYEQAPLRLAEAFLAFSQSKTVIMLLILALLLVLGMFLETLATLIILVPVLMPIVAHLGIDPVHFGIFLVLTNEVALLSPPLGVNLFVSSRIANIPVESVVIGILPYLGVLLLCTLLVAFIPEISLCLPRLLGYV